MRRAIVLGILLAGLAAGTAQAAPATFVHGLSPYPNPGRLPRCTAVGNAFRELRGRALGRRQDSPAFSDTRFADRHLAAGSLFVRRLQRTAGRLLAQRRAELGGPAPQRPAGDHELPGPRQQRDELRLGAGDRSMERHLAERRHVVHEPVVQRHAQPAQRDAGQQVRGRRGALDRAGHPDRRCEPPRLQRQEHVDRRPQRLQPVYAIWDRLVFPNERSQGDSSALHAAAFTGPTYFSKTENGTDDEAATGRRGRSSIWAATTRRSPTRSPSCRAPPARRRAR